MIKFDIKNRFSGSIVFSASIDATEDTSYRVQLGLAVRAAVAARASLAGANLAGANLADAYLADAYLAGANLTGANLAGANLAGANLTGANLTDAYLADAYLADAYLTDAYLAGANLAGATWHSGVVINRQPLYLSGLRYMVTLLDTHMQIGCQFHSYDAWASFDDEAILRMDGRSALAFWRSHKSTLLALAEADGRTSAPQAVAAE